MRRIVLGAAVVWGTALSAAPVGNPSFPGWIDQGFFSPCRFWVSGRVGYEGDFVFDGRLKQIEEGSGRVDQFKQDTNSGTATLNFVNRLDVYGVFGGSRFQSNWRFADADEGLHQVTLETDHGFLWALGARGILFQWGCTTLGLGVRYGETHPQPTWLSVDAIPASTSGSHFHWREWQADFEISYEIDLFSPYIGIKYSHVRARMGTFPVAISRSGTGRLHMKNRTEAGLIIGCSVSNGDYFMFNLEGRLIDEEAATISGDLKF